MITIIITDKPNVPTFNDTNQATISAYRGIINNTANLCVGRNRGAIDAYSQTTALRYPEYENQLVENA